MCQRSRGWPRLILCGDLRPRRPARRSPPRGKGASGKEREEMDKTLAGLLTPWWISGDKDAARLLADPLQQLSAEDVAEVLTEFRATATPAPQLADAFRFIGTSLAAVFRLTF